MISIRRASFLSTWLSPGRLTASDSSILSMADVFAWGRSGDLLQGDFENGDILKADGYMGRSLFDLYSNFTFFPQSQSDLTIRFMGTKSSSTIRACSRGSMRNTCMPTRFSDAVRFLRSVQIFMTIRSTWD